MLYLPVSLVAGARQVNDSLHIKIRWADKCIKQVPSNVLKAIPYCLLDLVDFYEKRVKPKQQKSRQGE